ncbi:unnamed protein product [Cuscuta campestris]|uniref:Uncharacterized protein n=1 Tax=Cuscuta campestris TaxID=132261 RepID=A0A484MP03_9ASTE|nr:unnamed protein product [Cuscuta campestris]
MDVQRYLKNLEIIYANEAILQGPTQWCYKCCGYGHIYWIWPNEHAVPYEEWAKINEEASRAEVLFEETICEEEKKSFNDQLVIVEDVSDFQVKDENDVFIEEPDSEVVVEETTPDVIYSKELNNTEYYRPIGEEESYFIFEGYVKQVLNFLQSLVRFPTILGSWYEPPYSRDYTLFAEEQIEANKVAIRERAKLLESVRKEKEFERRLCEGSDMMQKMLDDFQRERLEAEAKADKLVNDLCKAVELKRSLPSQDQMREINVQKEALEPKTNPEPINHQVPVLEDSPSPAPSQKPESITTLARATVVRLPECPPSQVSTSIVVHEVEPTEGPDSEPPMLTQEKKEEVLPMAINDHLLNCVEDTPLEESVLEEIEPTTYPQDSNVQESEEESIDEKIPSTEEPITSIDNHAPSEDLDQTFFDSLLDGCDFVCPKDSWSQKSWDELLVSDTEDSSMGESTVVIIKPQMDGQPVEDKEKINLAMKANDVDQLRRLLPPPTYLESPPFILLPPSCRDESRILDLDRATNQTRTEAEASKSKRRSPGVQIGTLELLRPTRPNKGDYETLELKINLKPLNHQTLVLEYSPRLTLSQKPESITTLASATVVMLPEPMPSQVPTNLVVHEVEPTKEPDSEPPMLIQEKVHTTNPQDSNVHDSKEEPIDEEKSCIERPTPSMITCANDYSTDDSDQTFFDSLLDGYDYVCPKDGWNLKSWDELLVSDDEDFSLGESTDIIIPPQIDSQPIEDKEKFNIAIKMDVAWMIPHGNRRTLQNMEELPLHSEEAKKKFLTWGNTKMLQPPMVLDLAYLDELGHWQDIDELLYDPKWRILLFLHAPASLEATIKYLCSLRFLNDGEEVKSAAEVTATTKVTFTLMGRLLNLTVADLGWLIGLYTLDETWSLAFANLRDQLDPEFDVKKFWQAHGHGRFHNGASLARNWARPSWRILHHALAHSYFGRSQEPDVFVLCGPMVTLLARGLRMSVPNVLPEAASMFRPPTGYLAMIAYNKEDKEARPRQKHTIPMTLRELSQAMFAFQDSVDSRLRSMETLLLTQQWQVEKILDYIQEQGAKKTEHEASRVLSKANVRDTTKPKQTRAQGVQLGRLAKLDALARLQTKEDTWQNLIGRSSSSVPIWTPELGRFDLDASASVL